VRSSWSSVPSSWSEAPSSWSSRLPRAGTRRDATSGPHRRDVWPGTPCASSARAVLPSARVTRGPSRCEARGEAVQKARRTAQLRRRGASPQCSGSAGLHPSPATQCTRADSRGRGVSGETRRTSHPTQIQIGEGRFNVLFPQVRPGKTRDIYVKFLVIAQFRPNSDLNMQVTRLRNLIEQGVNRNLWKTRMRPRQPTAPSLHRGCSP
jgi:hypothetical protein